MSADSPEHKKSRYEHYTFTGAEWEAEALSLFSRQWLEHRGTEIDTHLELKETLKDAPPTHIEIGSHRAAFLVGLGRKYPDETILGMEIRNKYHRLAGEHLEKHEIKNVLRFRGDAKLATIIAIEPESLDAVYVNFPDPWWKPRHAHRRLLDVPFLRVIARRLKPRGRLYLKSDVFEYLHAVRRFAEESQAFRPLPPERWPDESQWTWSEREAKSMRAAIPFARGYFERLKDFDCSRPTEPEEWVESEWDDMITAVEEIRGRPTIDRETRILTALAAKKRTEAPPSDASESAEESPSLDEASSPDRGED